jgi:hypothetical protein
MASAPLGTSLALQPLTSSPLNQYSESITNLLGSQGQSTQQTGQSLTSAGVAEAQPALNYWTGILSGNPTDVAAAAAPQINASNQQFQSQRKVLDQYTPMGGGRSQSLANLNTTRAQTNANIISNTQAGAAAPLASTALGQQQVGTTEQSLGIQQLGQAMQAILSRMGLNQSGDFANTFSSIMSGIGAII